MSEFRRVPADFTPEQRIIMRSYQHAYHNAKPPASEFPLFLYRDHVRLERRKRITAAERCR